jgi:hypothetical protein
MRECNSMGTLWAQTITPLQHHIATGFMVGVQGFEGQNVRGQHQAQSVYTVLG